MDEGLVKRVYRATVEDNSGRGGEAAEKIEERGETVTDREREGIVLARDREA